MVRVWGLIGLLLACLACAPAASARGIDAGAWRSTGATLKPKQDRVSVPLPNTITAEIESRELRELVLRFKEGCGLDGELLVDGDPIREFTVKSKRGKAELKSRAATGPHTVRLDLAPTGACSRAVLESSSFIEWIPIGSDLVADYMDDEDYAELVARKVDSVTAGQDMQWDAIEPEPGIFDFAGSDRVVDFAEANGMEVRGHPLVWRHFLPRWVKANSVTDGELIEMMRVHIQTIVGRYAGVVDEWDVVNEAVADDGRTLRDDSWRRRLGRNYIALAFAFAHEADPTARLYLNDYGAEEPSPKSDFLLRTARALLDAGVPIHGVGFQYHHSTQDWPDADSMEKNLERFADLGLAVQVTEADVVDNTGDVGNAHSRSQQRDAFQAGARACKRVVACERFTMWGLSDTYSWLGENKEPLPFDRHLKSKPSWAAITDHLRPK